MSTTPGEAREAVYARFVAMWLNGTPYTFENEKYEPPVDTAWVRVSVRNILSAQETLNVVGKRKFRRQALVFVQIFLPLGAGTQKSDSLVADIQGIFEGVSFGDLDFHAVSSSEAGVDEAWHQTLVEAPFAYEERK